MKTILIIDDNKMIFYLVKQIIDEDANLRNNLNILYSSNGLDGIVDICKNNPDLILLDDDMPNLNGMDVLTLIKNNPDYKNIPIVFFSSEKNVFQEIKCFMLGASDYLIKNLNKDDFLSVLNKYL